MAEPRFEVEQLQTDQRRLATMFRDQFRDFSQTVNKLITNISNQASTFQRFFTAQENFIRESEKRFDDFDKRLSELEKDMEKLVTINTRVMNQYDNASRNQQSIMQAVQGIRNKVDRLR